MHEIDDEDPNLVWVENCHMIGGSFCQSNGHMYETSVLTSNSHKSTDLHLHRRSRRFWFIDNLSHYLRAIMKTGK